MFRSLPFIQIFFLWKGLQKSLPKEAIFTINRYSSQDKTKCSFSDNKSEKMLFADYERGNISPIFLLHP